jgi:hypothetical protein
MVTFYDLTIKKDSDRVAASKPKASGMVGIAIPKLRLRLPPFWDDLKIDFVVT